MQGRIYFSEQQRFKQVWLWLLLIGINGFFIYGFITQVFLGKVFGDNPTNNGVLAALTLMVLAISICIAFARLETAIDETGVHYRFYPFFRIEKTIPWNRISEAYVRAYSPIGEYGGWGLRIGILGKGQAFNVAGNQGFQLVYDGGRRLLLGTQKPEMLRGALLQLGKLTKDGM